MNNQRVLKAIEELDLEPIKTKLMHAASGEGWSRTKAAAMDIEYRRFLYLMHAFPHEQVAPTVDVDTFWHYHILDTMKYAADCQTVFGYFMHHYPYVELETAADAGYEERGGDRMRELYEQTFGQAYIRAEAYGAAAIPAADIEQAGSQAAYCMYRPDAKALPATDVQQAGSQAAYCMYRPDAKTVQADVQQAGSQAAYCMYRPDAKAMQADVQQAGSQAAYCMYRPDAKAVQADVQQAGSQAAYCMYRPDAKALQAADVQQAGSQAAYCMYRPDAKALQAPDVQQAGSQAAYCMYRPDAKALQTPDVQQAGSQAAYCMYRPDASQVAQPAPTRDVQEAGAKAAYCMYRPDASSAQSDAGTEAAAAPVRPIKIGTWKAGEMNTGYRVLPAGTGKVGIAALAQQIAAAGQAAAWDWKHDNLGGERRADQPAGWMTPLFGSLPMMSLAMQQAS